MSRRDRIEKARQNQEPTVTERVEVVEQSLFVLPIPPPHVLAAYDQTIPGLAERIVVMAEKEQSFRHGAILNDQRIVARYGLLGQVSALVVGVGGLGAATVLALHGAALEGFGIAATSIAGLAGIFIWDRRVTKSTEKPSSPEAPPSG